MKNKVTAAIEKFNFHGDDLDVVPLQDGDVGLVLKRACEVLGLSDRGQSQRLARASAAGATWATTCIMHAVGKDGKTRAVEVIPRRSLPAWAATVDIARVREEIRPKVAAFHDEAAEALADHFLGKRERTGSVDFAPLMQAFATLASLVKAQNDRLDALESQARTGHVMAAERSNAIKKRVRSCALDLSKFGVEKARAASLRIHKRIKDRVGWSGVRCRLDNMPARHEADVLRELEIIEHETAGAVNAARQLRFPVLAVVGNRNAKRSAS